MGVSSTWRLHSPTPLETPCREWHGPRDVKGYGMKNDKSSGRRRQVPVHRWLWEQTHGRLAPGLCVLHRCDNPPCFRLDHLFVGTNRDNVDDRVRKDRGVRMPGESNPFARLTSEQAAEIRRRYSLGNITQTDLAHEYGISQSAVSAVCRGKTWGTTNPDPQAS